MIVRGDSSFESRVVDQFLIVTLRKRSGCLAEAPIDGLCKEYSGKNFPDSTTNYIGMMPYWDVSAVTNMNGAFENQGSFNADISWDSCLRKNVPKMMLKLDDFTQELSGWSIGSATSTFVNVPWCDSISGNVRVHERRRRASELVQLTTVCKRLKTWRLFMIEKFLLVSCLIRPRVYSWSKSFVPCCDIVVVMLVNAGLGTAPCGLSFLGTNLSRAKSNEHISALQG